ncbi:MAG: gliding motility-associated C-terminal domain-containing protein [Bacteroidales bacterium]|nr:gliding motility-associated C-terminal domain-containing protein [Bacteroidales bacterium]
MKNIRILVIVLLGTLYQVCNSQIYIYEMSPKEATCINGTAILIIRGGQPKTTPGTYYTYTNTGAGTMETTGNVGDNGIITITGLKNGDTYSIHIADGLGTTKDYSNVFASCTCQPVNFNSCAGLWTNCNPLPTTMSCTDNPINLNALPPSDQTTFNVSDLSPGFIVFTTCNQYGGNRLTFFENGVQDGGAFTLNSAVFPNMSMYIVFLWYYHLSSTLRIDLCRGATTGDNVVSVFLDKHSGHLLRTDNVVWPNSGCQSVTFARPPAPSLTGSAIFTGTGVTTDDNGSGIFNPSTAGPGVHTITYNWNNQNTDHPCSGSKSYTITVTNPFNANLTYPKNSYCAGETNPVPTFGTPGGNFTVIPSGLNINPTTGVIDIPGSTPGGPYKIIYTIGNLPCGDTASFLITITPQPVITISGNTPICLGSSDILVASGGTTYSWSNGQSTNPITVTPTVTTTYFVTGTTSGCKNTSSAVVTVNPYTPIGITGNTTCNGTCTTVTASGADNYTWDTGQTGSTISVCPTITTTYYVTGVNTVGCTGTNSAIVNVNGLPNVAATGGSVCNGLCTTVSASGANTYTWSTGQNGSAVSVCPTITTTYTVTGTNTSGGCTNSTAVVVIANANPTITANGGEICTGNSFIINATGGNLYTWNTGQSTSGITVSPTTTASYCVTGSDSYGCSNSYCVTINVNQKPNVTLSGTPQFICYGENTVLIPGGGTAYSWNNGLTPGTTKTVSPTQTTIYVVTGIDIKGCSNTAQTTITVNPELLSNTTPINEICDNDSGSACVAVTGGTSPYQYLWDIGATASCINNLHAGTYSVTVVDSKGCSKVNIVTVNNIMTNPAGTATADKYFDVITHLFLFDWNGTFGYKYHWDFGDGDTSNLRNPNHTYTKSGTYTVKLIVTSQNGCITEYTFTIEVVIPFKIEVFNVFTPNSDNINDKYRVKYEGDCSYFSMMIFNRWGKKLYETNDIDAGWNCDACPDGTYYYIIKATGKDGNEYDFHGYVGLIR